MPQFDEDDNDDDDEEEPTSATNSGSKWVKTDSECKLYKFIYFLWSSKHIH